MPPRRISLAEQRVHSEGQFKLHCRSARDLMLDADDQAARGDWSEASNKLSAAMVILAHASSVCRELRLIYALTED
jgi:hypothetical protein